MRFKAGLTPYSFAVRIIRSLSGESCRFITHVIEFDVNRQLKHILKCLTFVQFEFLSFSNTPVYGTCAITHTCLERISCLGKGRYISFFFYLRNVLKRLRRVGVCMLKLFSWISYEGEGNRLAHFLLMPLG